MTLVNLWSSKENTFYQNNKIKSLSPYTYALNQKQLVDFGNVFLQEGNQPLGGPWPCLKAVCLTVDPPWEALPSEEWGVGRNRRGCYLLNHYKLRVLLYWENLPEIWNTNYKWGKKLFKKGFSVYKVESDCPPSQATVVLGSTVVFPPFLCKRYQQGWSAVHPCIERWSEAWDSHSSTQILAAIRNSAHGQWEGPRVYRDPARSWTGLYLYGPWRSTHPCRVSLFTCCWLGLRSARVTLSNPTT